MGDLVLISNMSKTENFRFSKCIWFLLEVAVVCCWKMVPTAHSFAASSHFASISVTVIQHGNVIQNGVTSFQTEFWQLEKCNVNLPIFI